MDPNKENTNADASNNLIENLPSSEVKNNRQSNDRLVQIVELKKTKWDHIAEKVMVIVSVLLVIIAAFQWRAADKQVDAANKQIEVANAQIDVAKALHEETKKSDLKINPVDATYIVGRSDGDKVEIDIVFKNVSSRPTAILSIELETKDGTLTIESDGKTLPLNLEPWHAEQRTYSIKNVHSPLQNITVTDLDGKKHRAIGVRRQNASVFLTGTAMSMSGATVTAVTHETK